MSAQAWSPHPVYKTPSYEEAQALLAQPGKDGFRTALQEFHHKREEAIRLEREDPYHYHYHNPIWRPVEDALQTEPVVFLFGGNRSSKSEFAAWYTAKVLHERPNAQVLCGHTSAQSSIRMQQRLIWKYLPRELKDRPKPKGRKIDPLHYSDSGGFGGRIKQLIHPDTASTCWFASYNQSTNEVQGDAYDFAWCDELVPMSWLKEIYMRLVSRNGVLLCTFTPIEGYTRALAEAVKGVRIEKTKRAELLPEELVAVPGCPPGHMPREGRSPRGKCFWFWTEDNPWGGYPRMKDELALQDQTAKKLRAYGYVDRAITSLFPKFSESVNVVPAASVPMEGSCYHSIDPAAGRNWFMVWAKVTPLGDVYIYREWPDNKTYGDWAIDSDRADGSPGPAQSSDSGRAEYGYKWLVHNELEGDDEDIIERFIDPRTAAAPAKVDDFGNTTMLERLEEEEERMGEVVPGLHCTPAPPLNIEEGVNAINDLLDYRTDLPVDEINRPRLYISDDCQNLIWSMSNWTGKDGQKGACKDPVDALRYLITMDPQHIGLHTYRTQGGGSY